jgi:hypothetical protein
VPSDRGGHRAYGWLAALVVVAVAGAVVASQAGAHIERASYWPDPAADSSVKPAAGGEVPKARNLGSALHKAPPGDTRVVCQGAVPNRKRVDKLTRQLRRARRKRRAAYRRRASLQKRRAALVRVKKLKRKLRRAQRKYRRAAGRNDSIRLLKRSIAKARAKGEYEVRPTESRMFSSTDARKLLSFNERAVARCRFGSIQQAVNRSGNNDRIVILPGLYTEPESRKQPTGDPRCAHLQEQNDRGQATALSYRFQFECPNDQNLIAVMGRRPGPGKDPEQPAWDRHGIPNLGPCIRCNLQIEGSGVSADDVVIEAGDASKGNGGPSGVGSKKDVAIRADRADGFVLRNVTTRHAHEHNIYVLESDGYLLQNFKTFYPGEYGVLTFVEDHGVMEHCDAAGAGDAGLYPGAAAETGEETSERQPRLNQSIRYCDMHHSTAGFSATTGNAVHVHNNNFYDNALGLTTDVFTAAGHPGFPSDSMVIEDNNFYSNNFNPYAKGSDVEPTIPVPVGTGMWIAGGNNEDVRDNHFWDNWRRGTMLFSVPDAFVCNPGGNEQKGCDPAKVSTSHRNKHHDNVMGRTPTGQFDPNGVDFWWDEFAGNENNCWYRNTGKRGDAASVTSDPSSLPSDCASSRGTSGAREAELLNCLGDITFNTSTCPWFTTPPEPRQ